jgi:hypothetical protein
MTKKDYSDKQANHYATGKDEQRYVGKPIKVDQHLNDNTRFRKEAKKQKYVIGQRKKDAT